MPEYLGDAVYVDHDGYYLILTTSDGMIVTNRIMLEPDVLAALHRYLEWRAEMEAGNG